MTPFPFSGKPGFSISLGQGRYGLPAGRLRMDVRKSGPGLGQPAIIQYAATVPGVTKIGPAGFGYPKQIISANAVANVVSNSSTNFQIQFFLPSQLGSQTNDGTYLLTTTNAFVTWNVGSAANNVWAVTESREGNNRTWTWHYTDATKTWKLTEPSSLRESEFSVASDATSRTETSVGRKPGGADAFKIVRTFKTYAWGEGLTEERAGQDANPRVTTYHYYASGLTNASRLPLQQRVGPYGDWERYEYDDAGHLIKTIAQIGNSATNASESASRVTTYFYTVQGSHAGSSGDDASLQTNVARTVKEFSKGQEISRRYKIFKTGEEWDITCPTPEAEWDAPDNLTTITKKFTSGANQGRVASAKYPDGTMSFYDYPTNTAGAYRTNMVDMGQTNSGGTGVLNGTRTVTLLNATTGTISRLVYDLANDTVGALLAGDTYGNFDALNRPQRVTHLDGTHEDKQFACCGLDTTTDRDGTVTQYHYDDLKRVVATTRLGLTTSNILDAANRTVAVLRKGSDGSTLLLHGAGYDMVGRLLFETNALGGVTTYSEDIDPGGGNTHYIIYPDGGTRNEESFHDGSLSVLYGSATYPMRYEYDCEQDGGVWRTYTKETKLDANLSDTSEKRSVLDNGHFDLKGASVAYFDLRLVAILKN